MVNASFADADKKIFPKKPTSRFFRKYEKFVEQTFLIRNCFNFLERYKMIEFFNHNCRGVCKEFLEKNNNSLTYSDSIFDNDIEKYQIYYDEYDNYYAVKQD